MIPTILVIEDNPLNLELVLDPLGLGNNPAGTVAVNGKAGRR